MACIVYTIYGIMYKREETKGKRHDIMTAINKMALIKWKIFNSANGMVSGGLRAWLKWQTLMDPLANLDLAS